MTEKQHGKQANEIGVFSNPSAPTDIQKNSPKPRGSQSPFRQARQVQQLADSDQVETTAKPTTAFARTVLKTKQKPQLGDEIPTFDLQSATSIIDTRNFMNQSKALSSNSFIASQQSLTSEVLHFMADPQILVNFDTAPGELPRSIALERRRREIASVDIVKLFGDFIKKASKQTSKLALEMFDDDLYETKSLHSFFQIAKKVDIYDANRGEWRAVKGLHGHCFTKNPDSQQYEWMKCIVIGSKKIQQQNDIDDRLLICLKTEKAQKYWVPRLFVFVWGEDPHMYLKRLGTALEQRQLTESMLKYEACVSNMPFNNLLNLDDEFLQKLDQVFTEYQNRSSVTQQISQQTSYININKFQQVYSKIIVNCGRNVQQESLIREGAESQLDQQQSYQQNLDKMSKEYIATKQKLQQLIQLQLLDEINSLYKKAQNQMLFQISLVKQPSLITELELQLSYKYQNQLYQTVYNNEERQLYPYFYIRDQQLSYQEITAHKQLYKDTHQIISFNSFFTQVEAVKCLQFIQNEIFKLTQQQLNIQELEKCSVLQQYYHQNQLTYDFLIPNYSTYHIIQKLSQPTHPYNNLKSYSLEEFKQLQLTQQQNIKQFLEQNFINNVKMQLIQILKPCNKGHFNIDVRSLEVYKQSKLCRLLKRISLMLCDGMRDLCEQSAKQYEQMFYHQSLWEVKCVSQSNVMNKHEDNSDGGVTVYRQPIFSIILGAIQQNITQEDKSLLNKLSATYICGVTPLTEENIDLDDKEEEKTVEENASELVTEVTTEQVTTQEVIQDEQQQEQKQQEQVQQQQHQGRKKKDQKEPTIPKIQYTTTPEQFISTVLEVFDQGISCINQIPAIEYQILQNIENSDNVRIATPNPQEKSFVQLRENLKNYMESAIAPLNSLIGCFQHYRELLFTDDEKFGQTIKFRAELYLKHQQDQLKNSKQDDQEPSYLKNLKDPVLKQAVEQATPLSPADLRNLVHAQKQMKDDIIRQLPETIHCGAFIVRTHQLKNNLLNKCDNLIKVVVSLIESIATQKSNMISMIYFAINRKLTKKSTKIEDVCQLENFITNKLDNLLIIMKQNIQTMNDYHSILEELYMNLNNSQFALRWKTTAFPREIKKQVEKSLKIVQEDKLRFKEDQQDKQAQQGKIQETLQRQITSFANRFVKLEDIEAAYEECQYNADLLEKLIVNSALFNKREQLLNQQMTDYTILQTIKKEFEPQKMIWKCYHDFLQAKADVNSKDFKQLDAQRIEQIIDECQRNVAKASRNIPEAYDKLKEVADQVKRQIMEFKSNIPLLTLLRNQGMRKRHWIKVTKETGVDLHRLRYLNGIELKQYGSQDQEEKSEQDYTELTEEQVAELNAQPVNFTFKQALNEYHLDKYIDKIRQISESASKEYAIEQILNKLDLNWANVEFTLIQYQDQDCFILKALDDIIQLLDDNINLIQSMSASSFKVFFQEIISTWDKKLTMTSDAIDVWIQVQQAWLYLEPIFSSADIIRQLPTESKNFKQVDTFFRKLMNQTQKKPNVIQVCFETDKLLHRLEENLKMLEAVQKGLSNYLEQKRIFFPRFFFLSDDELLTILSNTKDPTSVQKFLRSCFENISSIDFIVSRDYEMVSMKSHEDEIVMFAEPMLPKGQVEEWMRELEKLCIKTVKLRCSETMAKYVDMVSKNGIQGRANWVKSGFAQGVVLVNQIMFCNDTEWAIKGGYLVRYKEQLDKQLSCMTDLVRTGLNKLESKVFSALLTYDVFQRDVVEGLIENKVTQIIDFDWAKHPKHICNLDELYSQPIHGVQKQEFYYDPKDYTLERYQQITSQLLVKANELKTDLLISYQQILSTLPYQFEYLGNTARLVITPLTLKIYSTISQSQGMFKFSAASGPAGSGKTETSKQMTNKEFGLVCMVFNCSEGMDLIGIKRMLSGVISSGGCLVMDEINRLSLDVLSVFAQMVLSVQRGLQLCGGSIVKQCQNYYGKNMAHIQTTPIVFENTELKLQSTAVVIITQNPNYSGRQKLPANLVALFRAVSVMVPNYNKICQIRLYSFGFTKATSLAQKAVSVFKLCSEQLSLCSWYDYGMRAINSTIQAAGNIRQQLGNLCVQEAKDIPLDKAGKIDQRYYTEDQIVLRAITEVNLPKFLYNDAVLFNSILKDLFPGVKQPYIDYNLLINELNDVLRSNTMNYLQPETSYVNKIIDLYMTINLRHGLMTLGPANSGKSESIYALMEAMNRLNKKEIEQKMHKFNTYLKQKPNTTLKDLDKHIAPDYDFMRYNIIRLDPKSITMDQLFGQFDPVSKEWQDGVLSTCVRKAAGDYKDWQSYVTNNMYSDSYVYGNVTTIQDVKPEVYIQRGNYTRQLVLCDGYIDSLWIESLNTVLDDSKRLCLTSGETIALSSTMNLVFNMDSVAEASPATISRNGMLYYTTLEILGINSTGKTDAGQLIQTGTLSINAFIQTWIDRLPDQIRLLKPDTTKLNDLQTKKTFDTKYGKTEEYSVITTRLKQLAEQILPETLAVTKNYCKQLQETMDSNLVLSVFKLVNTFINEVKPNDFGIIESWQLKKLGEYIDHIFLFSVIWAIGGCFSNEESRANFDTWIRFKWDSVSEFKIPKQINDTQITVYDLCLNVPNYAEIKEGFQKNDNVDEVLALFPVKFTIWGSESLQKVNLDELFFGEDMIGKVTPMYLKNLNLAEVIIPNKNNIQQSELIRRFVKNGINTLIVGQTGSGKTSVIKNYLLKHKQDLAVNIPILMNFSANTQAGEVQNYLDGKLDKRKRGVYGPKEIGKKCIFYVDDLNLPMKERYGCINSHEFLRQLIAHGGWYDLKELYFKQIIDTHVISSMCPPGGSRNPVTQRLVRHFMVQNFLELNNELLQGIFGQIVGWWASKVFDPTTLQEELANGIQKCVLNLVPTGIKIYENVRSGLLPTPAKMHYTFNLRDLSKLIQGVLMVTPASVYQNPPKEKGAVPELASVKEAQQHILDIFAHENLRVYSDRLVDEQDQKWFMDMMQEVISTAYVGMTVQNPETLLYGNICNNDKDAYVQMPDYQLIVKKMQEALVQYNETNPKEPMNLVLFKSAVQHLCRIVRILRQPNSNLLIIGVGGVGRLSLTKLASSILDYDVFSIQLKKGYGIAEWRADVKMCLMACGLQDKATIFLLQDQHVFNDRQLEDVSILLNSCDLQTIYDAAEMEKINSEMSKLYPGQTKLQNYDSYLKKIKSNLHVVICFSPSGTQLRTRLRKFPSLVNCCSIDYFLDWPEDALVNVAHQVYQFKKSDVQMIDQMQLEFLNMFIQQQVELSKKDKETIQSSIINFFVQAHQYVEHLSVSYKQEQSRFNHVTPTLFLNFITLFIQILQQNYTKINTYNTQLSSGLDQLQQTEVTVGQLNIQLQEAQPKLLEKKKQVEEMMIQLAADEKEANVTRDIVQEEKKKTSIKVEECKAIEADAVNQLQEGNLKLEDALKALNALEKSDFQELATYKSPSQAVIDVLNATGILLKLKSVKKDGKDDYMDEVKKECVNPNMIPNLKNYDKENIPAAIILKIAPYYNDPEFVADKIVKKSKVCAGLCLWVRAMYDYHHINLKVIPLRIAQKTANEELFVAQKNLDESTAKLHATEQKIARLKAESDEKKAELAQIEAQVTKTKLLIETADKLINSLKGEKARWIETLATMDVQIKCLLGDCLFSSAYIVYAGAFTSDFRQRLTKQFVQNLGTLDIASSRQDLKVTDILSDQVTLINYVNQYKLPSDQHSKENATMMFNTPKFCLLIDPEKQAQQFLKNYYREQLEVVKANDKDLLRSLENCIRFGKVIMIINVTQDIDPSLNSVLDRTLVKESGQLCIRLGDAFVPYNSSFRLFLCTHLSNPNYSPEQFVKLTVLNFAITPLGLQDQLLGQLVALERPDQEALKNSLMISNSKMKLELKQLEAKVLELLASNTGNILENKELIDTLSMSQVTSAEIKVKVAESEKTEAEIDKTRAQYIPMAQRGSILYFCIQDLAKIDFMYQYSLQWYMQLYIQSIQDTEQNNEVEIRLQLLISHFSLFLYQTICRSLFENHKLLFALLMTVRIQQNEDKVAVNELKQLLVGASSQIPNTSNPQPGWLAERSWAYIEELSQWQQFNGLADSFRDPIKSEQWQKIFESTTPENEPFPSPFNDNLSPFQKFFPVVALRPDRVIAFSRVYISTVLGNDYIQPQVFSIEKSFRDSSNIKPILFLLNDMADPMTDLMQFADVMRMGKNKTQALSLGRGIEKQALSLISQFAERGCWAVLQNCHLSVGFLKTLENTLEELQSNAGQVHRDFRLFLTSQPTPEFPVNILQNSVKISVENPNNLKANLLRVWEGNRQLQDGFTLPLGERYRKLVFSLSVFYSVLLQRKKYGSIGFNTPYAWSTADVNICIQQLPTFLERYQDAFPKEALLYLFAEINIGGCVTDATDQRTVNAIVQDYLNVDMFKDQWVFQSQLQKTEQTPPHMLHQLQSNLQFQDYVDFIKLKVPIECHPENLGMNLNSNITADRNESQSLLDDLMRVSAGKLVVQGAKKDKQDQVSANNQQNIDIQLINQLQQQVPKAYDLDAVQFKYPTKFEESLNSLLVQECGRFNVLLETMTVNLAELVRALKGLTIMSSELEEVLAAVQMNKQPELFQRYSYPSLKPLSSYMLDLNQRIKFLNNWIDGGKPVIYNISLFFFAQGFLTSLLQNYARKHTIAIDTINFDFQATDIIIDDQKFVMNNNKCLEEENLPDIPDCTFITGLYLEAAVYDQSTKKLVEARPRELYYKMPMLAFIPVVGNKQVKSDQYECPCYRTLARFGTLSTTGHSTNFMLMVYLPCNEGEARHWIKRSVALFASLND